MHFFAVVTITAADPDGLQANQGFNVEVGGDQGSPATVAIFDLTRVGDGSRVDPSSVSGDIWVVLDVQNNDETVAGIALTLGEDVIQCRGSSSDQATPGGLAKSGGQVEYTCLLKTATIMGECMGEQVDPMYANGEHALGAFITTAEGERREAAATQPVTLKNSSYVMIAHNAGRSVTKDGLRFHGGPAADDNMNSFNACPVSFEGTEVGSLTLEAKRTDTMRPTPNPVSGATTVSFQTGKDAPDNDPSPTLTEGPYTWTIDPMFNSKVETVPGMDEFWVVNSGDILDAAGADVTDEFRKGGEAMSGPHHFDYVGPTAAEGTAAIQIGTGMNAKDIMANASYSAAASNVFSLAGAMDMGVGVDDDMTKIAVGDCAANETNVSKIDRTKTAFTPIEGYEDVSSIADLDEDDARRATRTSPDKGGADCYVAEPAMLVDRLGNAWMGAKTPASWLQSANFGVDKTGPDITTITHDDGDFFMANPVAITFEVDNPKLASGDDGTALSGVVTMAAGTPIAPALDTVGTVAFNVGGDQDDAEARFAVPTNTAGDIVDGEYDVTVTVADGAMPANKASFDANLIYDGTPPTYSGPTYLGTVRGARTATIDVQGTLKDATSGIDSYKLQIRNNTAAGGNNPAFCQASEDVVLTRDRWPAGYPASSGFQGGVNARGSKSVSIPSLTVNHPGSAAAPPDTLCVTITDAEDEAGNMASDITAGFVVVDWEANVPRLVLTNVAAAAAAEEAAVASAGATPAMAPSVTPAGDVTVVFTSSNPDVLPAPENITFTVTNGTGSFDIVKDRAAGTAWTAANDDDAEDHAGDDAITITARATGGGYDGVTASFTVDVTDNDMMVESSPAEVDKGAITTVTITVTRSASQAAAGAETLTLAAATSAVAGVTFRDLGGANSDELAIAFAAGEASKTGEFRVVVAASVLAGETVTLTTAAVSAVVAARVRPDDGVTITVK